MCSETNTVLRPNAHVRILSKSKLDGSFVCPAHWFQHRNFQCKSDVNNVADLLIVRAVWIACEFVKAIRPPAPFESLNALVHPCKTAEIVKVNVFGSVNYHSIFGVKEVSTNEASIPNI